MKFQPFYPSQKQKRWYSDKNPLVKAAKFLSLMKLRKTQIPMKTPLRTIRQSLHYNESGTRGACNEPNHLLRSSLSGSWTNTACNRKRVNEPVMWNRIIISSDVWAWRHPRVRWGSQANASLINTSTPTCHSYDERRRSKLFLHPGPNPYNQLKG